MPLRMRLLNSSRLAACLLLLSVSPGLRAQTTQTQEAGPGLIVTYVEAPRAKGAALTADLRAYAGQIESGPGKPTVTILSELGRPNRMVVIEQWPDLSSPSVAGAETLLAAKAQPDAQAPMDRRVNHPLTPALAQALSTALPSTAFLVVMHIDIGLDPAAEAPKIVQAQRDAVLAAPGALGYEVAVQDQHANHFAVCEVWTSRAAYEAYTATGPAEDFSHRLAPLIGSPFDDRFYARVGY